MDSWLLVQLAPFLDSVVAVTATFVADLHERDKSRRVCMQPTSIMFNTFNTFITYGDIESFTLQ